MFQAVYEFKRRLIEQPLRELAYLFAGYLLIDIPIRAAEETVISWCREELASYLGVTRPSFTTVAAFLWHWIVPAIGILVIMVLYHRGNLRQNSALATPPSTDTRALELPRDSFLPWFMVMAAIALFVIFERQPEPIKGTVLLAENITLEGNPLGISWDGGYFTPINLSTPNAPLIGGLNFTGKNVGDTEITLKDAYIISAVDSTKLPITVSTPPGPSYRIEEIRPIPANAWINFIVNFDGGLSESEFVNRWSRFRIFIESDKNNLTRNFDTSWVMQRMTALHPEAEPHVSKRQP
jgi:hypothetical protein